jgi:hypothetical protein
MERDRLLLTICPRVIPGRAEGASPESITMAAEHGVRARELRPRAGMTAMVIFQ